MVSCRRKPGGLLVEHWCRHRTGHALAEPFGLDLPQHCLLQKHRLAGHLARSAANSLAHRTLTARDLRWWRHAQAAHERLKDKWSGVHSQRFNVWRWETPQESFYVRVRREPGAAVTSKGWLLKAQNRAAWKRDEWDFAARRDEAFCWYRPYGKTPLTSPQPPVGFMPVPRGPMSAQARLASSHLCSQLSAGVTPSSRA